MKTKARGFLSAALALVMVLALMVPAVSALDISVGNEFGGGKVTAFEEKTLGTGLTYSKTTFTDAEERNQAMYALEFNPKTSDFMPVVYSRWTGTGATTLLGGQNLETQFGADVYAGVNANFYDTSTGSTYAGYWVHDGRLAQAEYGYQSDIIAFTSDGEMQIVNSKLTFDVYFNGSLVTYNGSNSLAYINKNSTASNVSNLFYYWDTECGNKTDSKLDGVEIVCEKQNGGELGVERTLTGKIVEIRENSHNSAVGADQFVLYVKNDSPLKDAIAGTYKVGDTVSICVNEEVEASKAVTSQAVTAFAAQYRIVADGIYAPGDDTVSLDHYNQRAQRTSVGLKEDGTVVIICTAGRNVTDDAPGLTIPELGQLMLDLGCVVAYNLDGGGSTQMITKAEGEEDFTVWKNESTNGRSVANSLYIVKRPAAVETGDLNFLIAAVEDKEIDTDEVRAALASAKALLTAAKVMEGDVIRETMKLQNILDAESELTEALAACEEAEITDYSPSALGILRAAYETASQLDVQTTDSDTILNAARALKTAVDNQGPIAINITLGKDYETLQHYAATDNYGDSGNELTDGEIGNINNAYASPWVAYTTRQNASGTTTVDGTSRRYYDIVVDLGETIENIKDFNVYTEYLHDSGIDYCIAVDYAVSTDGTDWTTAGRAAPSPEVVAEVNGDYAYPLSLDTGVSGRYLRVRLIAAGTTQFIFVTELQAFAYEEPVELTLSTDKETGYLTGLTPGMTVDEVKDQFLFPSDVVITDAAKGDAVGTGTQVSYDGSTWTAVLIGDLNGDANVTGSDYPLAKRSILDLAELNDAQTEAFKLGGTSEPTPTNYLKLKRHVLKLSDLFA